MSDFLLYIKLDPYLAQWFINQMGGSTPVKLIKGCVESKHLQLFLEKRPPGVLPESPEGKVAVEIPYFRVKPPEVYNYLPEDAMKSLVKLIRDRFDWQLFTDIHVFKNMVFEQKELIYAWMNQNGIEKTGTNWDAIVMRYRVLRRRYLKNLRNKKYYENHKKCN